MILTLTLHRPFYLQNDTRLIYLNQLIGIVFCPVVGFFELRINKYYYTAVTDFLALHKRIGSV